MDMVINRLFPAYNIYIIYVIPPKNEGMNYTINIRIVVYTSILGDMYMVFTLLL